MDETIDELIDKGIEYKKRCFKAVILKVESPDWKVELEPLKIVREAVGIDISVIMDANQGIGDPATGLVRIHRVEYDIPSDVDWRF